LKRWNGWGEETIRYPLPNSAAHYLADQLGEGARLEDVTLAQVLATVGRSRLPAPERLSPHSLISTDPEERLRHARGQSLPDWIALRSGQIGAFPDGVAYPVSAEEVRTLLEYARMNGLKVIPYGGGTSVVGHVTALPGDAPVLTMDLSRLNRLLALDETSRLATFEAGILGPEIEKQLAARGYTLGHFPQSFELSTLGGWIATRSTGQQSYRYGRMENLFAGGHVETPIGALDLPAHPASAAGPDLKHIILGSEGRLGVVTRATVRLQQLPEVESFYGVFFHDWKQGAAAVREIAQVGIAVSMLRLSNAMETQTTLALSGKDDLVKWAERGLRVAGYGAGRSMLVLGVTGTRRQARNARLEALEIIRAHAGLMTGKTIGRMWQKSRFYTPYLRNTLWEAGYALDTLETAIPWSQVIEPAEETQKIVREGLQNIGERVVVFAHLSHVYKDGASIYITYLYRRVDDPQETLRRWQVLKDAASRFIVARAGTISHQHGIGLDHAQYLAAEKSPLGMQALETITRLFDPQGMMNPGKLLINNREEASS
jgi:alkyldihydroxyacetonephosphate synthase